MLLNNGWNNRNEKILTTLGENAAAYKWMHEKSYSLYNFLHKCISLITLILSTSLSAESVIPDQDSSGIKVYRQVSIYIVTFISVLQNFLKLEKTATNHANQSAKYSEFYHDIQQKFSVYRRDRGNAQEYLGKMMKLYDDYNTNGPKIDSLVIGRFKKAFKDKKVSIPVIADNIEQIQVVAEEPDQGVLSNIFNITENPTVNLRDMNECLQFQGDITDELENTMDDRTKTKLNTYHINKLTQYELDRYNNFSGMDV